ncbi:MAG: sulfotransferase family protein [Chloroflexi bacterium]|nr:sulfotransferase family protein [Chloroflexota bacterium]MCC6893688.1 sulfotransferase family 2 domain-containing protein [Anaerolineae bacterium]
MASARYTITENDVLYYLHIHKTAGTSFTQIIIDNLGLERVYQPTSAYEFLTTPPEVVAKTRFLVGHLYHDITPVFTRNPLIITTLRDPIERTISQYAQIHRAANHYAHEWVKNQSLLEYLKDPRSLSIYANLQTRHIGAELNVAKMAAELDPAVREQQLEPHMLQYTNERRNDPRLLETAQQRLESYAFVGLTEQYDESVEVLCDTFGWALPDYPKVMNVGGNRPTDIPQEALDIIYENTRLDADLYETGKRILQARYQESVNQHPERARKASTINVNNLDQAAKRIAQQQSMLDNVQAYNAALEKQLADYDAETKRLTVELNRLYQIENSFGWRFILRVSSLRRKLIPEGSPIENAYQKIRNRFA